MRFRERVIQNVLSMQITKMYILYKPNFFKLSFSSIKLCVQLYILNQNVFYGQCSPTLRNKVIASVIDCVEGTRSNFCYIFQWFEFQWLHWRPCQGQQMIQGEPANSESLLWDQAQGCHTTTVDSAFILKSLKATKKSFKKKGHCLQIMCYETKAKGTTVNSTFIVDSLKALQKAKKKKGHLLPDQGFLIHWGNAPLQSSNYAKVYLAFKDYQIINHFNIHLIWCQPDSGYFLFWRPSFQGSQWPRRPSKVTWNGSPSPLSWKPSLWPSKSGLIFVRYA